MDLERTVTVLGNLRDEAERLRRACEVVIAMLDDAASELKGVDDPAAQEALEAIWRAHDHVGNTAYGWVGNYVRRNGELVVLLRD